MKAINNYYKSTPVKWRKIGDTILLGCTSLSALMMGAPLKEHTITWIVFILNVVGVIGKVITNFFKEDEVQA